ncbi:dolichyl-diphosphooligosaccharide--protein glycosyltransferase subunit 2 [Venturia canescens]|uniref:dolichyl-diphosphooligosaccharide--protein glycosyltransferase subunit 2 n=1 Tax=Venturia canescens TaxID=32260 RepID=UPI001C9C5AD2|nr:dolichyl-diphosphooligosaccharide--protein glycosyltransferase subunit 2 [Venturia canescens]
MTGSRVTFVQNRKSSLSWHRYYRKKNMGHLMLGLAVIAAILIPPIIAAPEEPTSTSSYLTQSDRIHLKTVIEPGFKFSDVETTFYAVIGYRLLGEPIPKTKESCEYLLAEANKGEASPEDIYYIVTAWRALGSCQPVPTAKLAQILTKVIEKETSTIPELYFATSALVTLSQKMSAATVSKLVKLVQAALKKDDSIQNLGYTFHIASFLGQEGKFAWDKIPDAVVQADETNGRLLHFEGGLPVTSLVIDGIARLSTSLKEPPSVKDHQIVKLANYLLSRHSVQTPKGVVKLLSALTTLANNELNKPVSISLAEGGLIVSPEQPLVKVKVCDILGRPLPTTPVVVANSATRVEDDVVVISKRNFEASPTDKTLFTMNLMEIKPHRGFYKIAISAGKVSNVVSVKVLSEVRVDYLEIGTGDADQTTQPKLVKVAYPQKLAEKIEADSQQKLVIRFLLRDSANEKPMRVHQAFVRLYSVSSTKQGREIHFVAEPDASHVYKFDMPVGSAAQTFGYQSGDYNVELIVGDATLSNSFAWPLASVSLKFPEPSGSEVAAAKKPSAYKQKPNIYTPKPEIQHMFREPEKRPPVFVSNLFTGLCLAPIFLLLGLWAKLRVNISKFPFSLSAIVFHLGLASIFILFGIFWLRLDMFVTLRYLLGLGVVTFLAGSKLLSQIAQSHKSSR